MAFAKQTLSEISDSKRMERQADLSALLWGRGRFWSNRSPRGLEI